MKSLFFPLLASLVCVAGLPANAQTGAPTKKPSGSLVTVRTIEQSVTKIGGKATVSKYACAQDPATDDFTALTKIAAGSKEWVDLAVRLLPYADAGCSESLHNCLGKAMQKQPLNVLPYVGKSPQLTPELICLPFISAELPDAEALRAVRRSKAALLSVRNQALSQQCQACMTQVISLEKKILADIVRKKKN